MAALSSYSALTLRELKVGTGAHSLTNTLPSVATFKVVPGLTECPWGIGFETDVTDFNNVGEDFNRQCPTMKKFGSFEIEMHAYSQAEMDLVRSAADTKQELQFMITCWQDAAKTIGMYSIFNGFVTSVSVNGGKDKVATHKIKIVISNPLVKNQPVA